MDTRGMKTVEPGKLLTANRLTDGAVVFFTSGGLWSQDINEAVLARDSGAADALVRRGCDAEADNIVVEAVLIAAERDDGKIVPRHIRERIRARGPTVGGEGHVPL